MKFPAVVTSPSIYHGCSTRKTFWEEKFIGKEYLFLSINMKNCGRRKVRKHKEIRGSDKIVTLDISVKFDILNKTETTSSESKQKLERSGKGLVTALAFKTKVRSQKYKKARYAIGNVSEKDISKIIKRFEKIEKLPYEKKSPKHEPTVSSFHLAREIAKCMMRSNKLNWYDHINYTKMTAPYSNIIVTNESESKRSTVNEKLSQSGSKTRTNQNSVLFLPHSNTLETLK